MLPDVWDVEQHHGQPFQTQPEGPALVARLQLGRDPGSFQQMCWYELRHSPHTLSRYDLAAQRITLQPWKALQLELNDSQYKAALEHHGPRFCPRGSMPPL